MNDLHRLLARQIRRARREDGSLDLERLTELVNASYVEADHDRRRTDLSIRMMVEEMDHRAEHDAMTGLANRTRFTAQLQRAMGSDEAPGHVAVMFLDLDLFKEVNDTLGHAAGDDLLREVARRLTAAVGDRGLVARLGGDEFAIILWQAPSREAPAAIARSIVADLSRPFNLDGKQTVIGVSIGIAMTPEHGRNAGDLLRRADMALYRAKQSGRGKFSFFRAEMDAALVNRKTIERDMRGAIMNGGFELHYQPIVNGLTRQTACYEALIRWDHPERGFIAPADFIPIAEATGLIIPIGEWVIEKACLQAQRFPDGVNTAINLSPVQFRSPELVPAFERALHTSGLDPTRMEIEITESVLLQEDAKTHAVLSRLRALGLRFSLDDFGTGHSSLSYLQKFPFDKIKIDRSFCSSVNSNPVNAALVRAVARLGRDLGIEVVAEGVENLQESAALIAEGCGQLQGYYYGHPAPAVSDAGLMESAIALAKETLGRFETDAPPASPKASAAA